MMKKKEILQSLLKLVVIVFAATVLGKIFTGLGFPVDTLVPDTISKIERLLIKDNDCIKCCLLCQASNVLNEQNLVSCYECSPETADLEFAMTAMIIT